MFDFPTQAALSVIVLLAAGTGVLCVLYASSNPRDLPPHPGGGHVIPISSVSVEYTWRNRKAA